MVAEKAERGVEVILMSIHCCGILLRNLQLSDVKQDGVVLAAKDREALPEVKWMAAAKLLTRKDFSATALYSTMRSAWEEPVCDPGFLPG